MRWLAVLAAVAALGLGGASQQSPSGPTGQQQAAKPTTSTKADSPERLSAYERESLAISRVANGISERANLISDDQRAYAFWQLVLGGFVMGFTGCAAFFAWRATVWAKAAAVHTEASAKTAADALRDSRTADAEQAERFRQQLEVATKAAVAAERQFNILGDQTDVIKKQHAVGRLAFIATHRPRIRVRNVMHAGPMPDDHWIAGLVIVNIGPLEARIDEARGALLLRERRTGMWGAPGFKLADLSLGLPPDRVLASGARAQYPLSSAEPIGMGFDNDLRAQVIDLMAVGEITYLDDADGRRTTGFCWRWNPNTFAFHPMGDEVLSYED